MATVAAKKDSPTKVSNQLKFGFKHVTTLVEENKAPLVLIACEVDPFELAL